MLWFRNFVAVANAENLLDFRASSINYEIKNFWFIGTELIRHYFIIFLERCCFKSASAKDRKP
ncbi:hypothetical protein FH5T_16390 [Draconibacterium orientale]|uniref:Uncharacterized protein n=1 Tax=Draconibacterium orientale TaxID=1168034 RepID=A0ABM5QER5_9BACT|nr:hypothetical protein FH5T_16390 [Draconibacterium orientale]